MPQGGGEVIPERDLLRYRAINAATSGERAYWLAEYEHEIDRVRAEQATCYRCADPASRWLDGPGSDPFNPKRRAICDGCEYADWRATAAAYNTGQAT